MHQSVVEHFIDFTAPLEGKVAWMYLDVLGLVTTGIGNLIDPVTAALALPWKLPDGSLASRDLVASQWRALKAQQQLAKLHYKFAAPYTTVRLTDEDIAELVKGRLLANEAALKKVFPEWEAWPADAQLFASSMAWAVGAGWPHIFGNCTKFLLAGDWANASLCAAIKTEGNPGIVPRNAQNRLCLANALAVTQLHLDPATLFWPNVAHPDDQPVASEAKAELDILTAKQAIALGEWAFNATGSLGHSGSDGINEEFQEQFEAEHPTIPSPPPEEDPKV